MMHPNIQGGQPDFVDPVIKDMNRRDLIKGLFIGGVAAAALGYKLLGGSSSSAQADPSLNPVGNHSMPVDSLSPISGPGTIPQESVVTTEAVTTTTSTTTKTTVPDTLAPATTTTESTVPPSTEVVKGLERLSPEFKVTFPYNPGDKIGNITVWSSQQGGGAFINVPWHKTDNPYAPKIADSPPNKANPGLHELLQKEGGAAYYDYYIGEGPGKEDDSIWPGEKLARNADGSIAENIGQHLGNRPPVILGHDVSHTAPFYLLHSVVKGDVITISYDDYRDTGTFGKTIKYEVIQDALQMRADDPNTVPYIRGYANEIPPDDLLTLYNCWPPHESTLRNIIRARRVYSEGEVSAAVTPAT
jgi:hypothetical protein